jgi:ADP-ribosylation factor family
MVAMFQAIIYVVASSDKDRISTSADEFHAILSEEELKDALILVYANKQVRSNMLLQETCASLI